MTPAIYEKQSLSDVVVGYIKSRILSGALKSGDKLIEADISTALDISRAPVREAMRILNEQGIVTFLPRKGNQVIAMEMEEIQEVFEIRIALEIRVLSKLITQKMLTEKDFRELETLTEKMKKAESQCNNREEGIYLLNTLDLSFHRYLWKASGSIRSIQLLEGLFYQLLIAMNQNIDSLGTFQEKAQEHARIVNGLKAQDLKLTLSEFREHLNAYMRDSIGREMVASESDPIYS